MNTRQIIAVLQADPLTRSQFQGVFPSDSLPNQIQRYPAAFVANVDPQGEPGSHWCAFYFTQDQKGEFFDSYGLKPDDYSQAFQDFITKNSVDWIYNQRDLQSLDSNVCGHYCLYYLLNRCRNISMKAIVDRFSPSKKINDKFVYRFIVKHFSHIYHYIKNHVTHQISRKLKQK